jgi:transcriptional regulator with XRE-family HTH domain
MCKENLTMTKKYFLPEWTTKILIDTGWSQTELANRANLSRTSVNDVINRKVRGGYKFAIAVAEAADRPIDEGLQAAGVMDIPPEQDEKTLELIHLIKQMTAETKDDTLEYAKLRLKKQKREGKKSDGKRDRDR